MNLPNSLISAFEAGYRDFSWVSPLPLDFEPSLSLFDKSQESYQGQRFYWQTPSQDLTLIGCGYLTTLNPTALTDKELSQWITNKRDSFYHNQHVTSTGALIFGGLPFNPKHQAKAIWGELDQGLFYLPALMVSYLKEAVYLTINFSATSIEELEVNWRQGQTDFQKWLAAKPTPKKTATALTTKEIGLQQWLGTIEQTVAALKADTPLTKVVLARQLEVTSQSAWQPTTILTNLTKQQPATYLYALEAQEQLFIGASPERLLQSTEDKYITACIAGSIGRGQTLEEDQRLGQTLLADAKNQEEHHIVLQQIAEDFQLLIEENLSTPIPSLLKNRDIQHLHVPLQGKRKTGTNLLRGVELLHPTPALGGQPKNLARKFIAQNEPIGRGMYGAPIGWISLQDDCGEFAVGIRSAILTNKTGYLYAGCGIVADSIPELERQETAIKFQPMLRGLS